MVSIQWRELYIDGFIIDTFNIGMHLDIYELISFKHSIMLDMIKLQFNANLNNLDLHSRTWAY